MKCPPFGHGHTSAELHHSSFPVTHDRHVFLAVVEYSLTKLVVSSRRRCRLTVDDILTHRAADDNGDRFLNIEEADLQPHLDHISDRSLAETLKHGIGYYHEALSKQDKRIVERLFQSGAIQVLIASKVRTIIIFMYCIVT